MPSKDLIESEGVLRIVIENLIDAQEALKSIAEDTRNEMLRRYCFAESLKRAEFRGEIENILHQEGVRDVYETGTPGGAVVRAWTTVKARLGGGDHALLSAATDGERSLLDAYASAIEKALPLPMRLMLAQQSEQVEHSLEYLRAARDASA